MIKTHMKFQKIIPCFETSDSHVAFLDLISQYYNKSTLPKNLPAGICNAVKYLKSVGVNSIALIGICWGGCIVQHLLSIGNALTISKKVKNIVLDDSFSSGVSIDGLFYQPNFTALVPCLFILGQDKTRRPEQKEMKTVMWSNNICKL